jgi:hypothetical protein
MPRPTSLLLAVPCLLLARPPGASAQNYSMACVEKYSDASGFTAGWDVSLTCDATDGFAFWFAFFGSPSRRYYWHNTLVWPRDYTEDSFTGGGDDIEIDWSSADLNVFSGHGICQSPPAASSGDFIVTAKDGLGVSANLVNVHSAMRAGEFPGSGVFGANGNLNTFMINASCPMDLVSLTTQWWDVFQGLHLAMGHSGTATQDNLDSNRKLPTVGMYLGPMFASYRTAWMSAGLIDVQNGVCAVIAGTGRTESEAVNRRDFETPTVRASDALPATWIAWRWTCR